MKNREGFARFMEASEAGEAAGTRQAAGVAAALAALAAALGLKPEDRADALMATIPFGPDFGADYLGLLAALFEGGGKRDKEQAERMRGLAQKPSP